MDVIKIDRSYHRELLVGDDGGWSIKVWRVLNGKMDLIAEPKKLATPVVCADVKGDICLCQYAAIKLGLKWKEDHFRLNKAMREAFSAVEADDARKTVVFV